jgi:Zn-dependent oligopeptidase
VCSNALVQLSEEVLQTHGLFAELHHTLERQDGSGTDISIVALFLEQLRKAEESSYATTEEQIKAMQQLAVEVSQLTQTLEGAYDSLKNADGHVAVVTSKVLHWLYKCW